MVVLVFPQTWSPDLYFVCFIVLETIAEFRLRIEPSKKNASGPAPSSSIGDVFETLLEAVETACVEDYKKQDEIKTNLVRTRTRKARPAVTQKVSICAFLSEFSLALAQTGKFPLFLGFYIMWFCLPLVPHKNLSSECTGHFPSHHCCRNGFDTAFCACAAKSAHFVLYSTEILIVASLDDGKGRRLCFLQEGVWQKGEVRPQEA